ncbi:MAG: hypothetical protein NW217_13470 [Hyphomicrobiaceae bacterium]|nr:hypothetical protein [Hyphomicrobiaceae bacterium]
MSELLTQAFEAVRALPEPEQDEIARLVLRLASHDDEAEPIDPAHLPGVLEGLAQAERREFASDEAVASAFARFGK